MLQTFIHNITSFVQIWKVKNVIILCSRLFIIVVLIFKMILFFVIFLLIVKGTIHTVILGLHWNNTIWVGFDSKSWSKRLSIYSLWRFLMVGNYLWYVDIFFAKKIERILNIYSALWSICLQICIITDWD